MSTEASLNFDWIRKKFREVMPSETANEKDARLETEAELIDENRSFSLDKIRDKFRASSADTDLTSADLDRIRDKFKESSSKEPSPPDDDDVSDSDLDAIVTKFKTESPKIKPVEPVDFSKIRRSFNESFPAHSDAGKTAVNKYRAVDTSGIVEQASEGLVTVFKGAAANVSPAEDDEGDSGFRKGSTLDIVSEVGHGLGEAVLNVFTGTGGTHLKRVATDTQRGLVRDNVSLKDRGLEP